MLFRLVFVFLCLSSSAFSWRNTYPRGESKKVSVPSGDCGEPLFLTPYIENNKTEEGKKAAYVTPFIGGIHSYSGFFTVDKTHNSSIFFWFFPAELNPKDAPLVLWLQGGPGASSMYGLFAEIGAYYIDLDQNLLQRTYYWSQTMNVIFIDQPVGTGFSFTESDEGYPSNESQIGEQLYSVLQQFLQIFPEYKKNHFYITGESYAGKYIPALGYTIHTKNPSADLKINLKGMAIGNGWCDPVTQIDYADLLYQIGLIDFNDRKVFHAQQKEIKELINEKKYLKAFDKIDSFIDGDLTTFNTLFYNVTGFSFYMNYLSTVDDDPYGSYVRFFGRSKIRKHLHVGTIPFDDSNEKVEYYLKADTVESIKPWIEVLIENYKMLFYNGQLDIIVAYPLTLQFLRSLKWSGQDEYEKARREIWRVGGNIAGYKKTVRNLTEVLVRDAGHTVPTYQPLWTLDLINRFITNKPYQRSNSIV